jgi:molybdopterin molybdotransferase
VSGSELAAGAPPEPGQIFDANGPALAAALSRLGVNSRRRLVPDEPALLETALAEALNAADVLLVSGGVSVGDFDYTRRCLDRLGFREIFWRVAIKPGMPLLFGLCPSRSGGPDKPVFGLPGNPLSALVCFEEFVRPALDRMQGAASAPSLYAWEGAALNDFPKPLQRQQFIFCRAEPGPGGYGLSLFRPQGSALLARASAANALAVSPCGVGRVRAGDRLPFRWLA